VRIETSELSTSIPSHVTSDLRSGRESFAPDWTDVNVFTDKVESPSRAVGPSSRSCISQLWPFVLTRAYIPIRMRPFYEVVSGNG
jgi:hypothetical protein